MGKRALIVFGTRPEAIKMAPLVKEMQRRGQDKIGYKICVTAQHREMLDQVLSFFELVPDYDLNLMLPNQDLFQLSSSLLLGLQTVLEDYKPDLIFVHGDTTTSFIAAVAAFYKKIKVCHIEAGLRTYNKYSPFPEEMNRQITGRLADFHFAPTALASENLQNEHVDIDRIFITGNTVIDALMYAKDKVETIEDMEIDNLRKSIYNDSQKMILVTGHRRENFGDGFVNICNALKLIAERKPDIQIIYPVHLNPNVLKPVHEILQNIKNVKLIKPLAYPAFIWLMKRAYFILTDSGGIQEEAPSLGKPVLVMRNTTERPEAVKAKTVELVGANSDMIVKKSIELLENAKKYNAMKLAHNPYGDGKASEKIVDAITGVL